MGTRGQHGTTLHLYFPPSPVSLPPRKWPKREVDNTGEEKPQKCREQGASTGEDDTSRGMPDVETVGGDWNLPSWNIQQGHAPIDAFLDFHEDIDNETDSDHISDISDEHISTSNLETTPV
jgi:hypothetical protein